MKKIGFGKKADRIAQEIKTLANRSDGRSSMWGFMKNAGFKQEPKLSQGEEIWDEWGKWNSLDDGEKRRKARKLDEEAKEEKKEKLQDRGKTMLEKSKVSLVDLWMRAYYEKLARAISECWCRDARAWGKSRKYSTWGGDVASLGNKFSYPDLSTLKTPENTIHAERLAPNNLTQCVCSVVKLSSPPSERKTETEPPAHIDSELCANRPSGSYVVVKRGAESAESTSWYIVVGVQLNPYRVYMVQAEKAENGPDETKVYLSGVIDASKELILGGSRNGDWWQFEIFFGEVNGSRSVSVRSDEGVIRQRKPKKKNGENGEGKVKSEVRYVPLRGATNVERQERKADDRKIFKRRFSDY